MCHVQGLPLEVSLNLLKCDASHAVGQADQLSILCWVTLQQVECTTVHHPHMSTMLVGNALPSEISQIMSSEHGHTSIVIRTLAKSRESGVCMYMYLYIHVHVYIP